MGLWGCYQQVEILTECIRKKDAELNQYRIEQAVLRRSKFNFFFFNLENISSFEITNVKFFKRAINLN